jgi:hypothetical protein
MSPPWDVVGGLTFMGASALFKWLYERANSSGREIEVSYLFNLVCIVPAYMR